MKKITKTNFQGLRQLFPVLRKDEMRQCVGGSSDGYYGNDWLNHGFGGYDPDGNYYWHSGYSQDEFYGNEGPWYGGWVYGLGYVYPDAGCVGYRTIYGHYDTIHGTYDPVEGVGIYGSYKEDTYTRIRDGQLTVSTSVFNPTNQYDMIGQVVVYENGEERDVFELQISGSYYTSPGMNPLGSVTIDLTQYHGHVQVKVRTSGSRGDSYTGYSAVNGESIVYDNNQ